MASAVDITSEGRSRQAPYKRIKDNLSQYVDAEYLPDPHFKIADPRNMHRPDLLTFFRHIVERQRTYDLAEVFRFKFADAGRKSKLGVGNSPEVDDNTLADDVPPAELTAADSQDIVGASGGRVIPHRKKNKQKSKKTKKTSNIPNVTDDGGAAPVEEVAPMPGQGRQKATSKRTKGKAMVDIDVTGAMDNHAESDIANDDIPAPQRRPTKATKKKSKTVLRGGVPVVDVQRGEPHNAADVPDADVPQRPRPKPKPKGKKATQIPIPGATGPEYDVPAAAPATAAGPLQRQSTVIGDNVIDPALLGTTSHTDPAARPVLKTADNLALQEAQQYGAPGKRVPKKRR